MEQRRAAGGRKGKGKQAVPAGSTQQQLLSPISDSHTETESAESETETNAANLSISNQDWQKPTLHKAITFVTYLQQQNITFW